LLAGRLTGLLGHDLAWLLDHGLTRLLVDHLPGLRGLNHGLLVARLHHSRLLNERLGGRVCALGILPQAAEGMHIEGDPGDVGWSHQDPGPAFERCFKAEKDDRHVETDDLSAKEHKGPCFVQGAACIAEGWQPQYSGNTLHQAKNAQIEKPNS